MDGEIYHIRAIKRNEGDILNADLSHVIASMGHTDLIMIVNAGLRSLDSIYHRIVDCAGLHSRVVAIQYDPTQLVVEALD